MKDQHRPLIGVKAAEAALELIAIGDIDRGIESRDSCLPDLELDRPSPSSAPRFAIAGTDEEPVEPGLETIGVTQGREIAPGRDERVLGGVLGLLVVPEDQASGSVEPADRHARQL